MTQGVWPRPLLYRRVAPWVAELGLSRPVKAWVIGVEDDLSSITRTVGARAAHRQPGGSHVELKLYASLLPTDGPSHRSGTEVEERAAEATHDDRWPELEVDLRMGEPGEQVDLAAVHSRDGRQSGWRRAWETLRPGGRLLLDRSPSKPPEAMITLDQAGLLFEKEARSDAPATELAPAAQRRLVNDHMALARSLARRFEGRGEPTEELRQVALTALVSCSRRFDPGRRVAFSSYATGSILGELKRHFRDRAWGMRVGRSIQETYLEVNRARDTLSQQKGRSPTVSEIAHEIGSTDERVIEAMDAERAYWLASLDAPREDTGEGIELPSFDEGFEKTLDRHQFEQLLPGLSRRELMILERRYFREWTQERIANDIGVSQMQVSRLLARTLAALRVGFAKGDAVSVPSDA